MNAQTANKLDMYKAVESVFTLHASKWNFFPGLSSAFSRFALKVAQIDLLSDNAHTEHTGERIRHLIQEIDQLLQTKMDRRIKQLQTEQNEFYSEYVSARTLC